MKSKIQIFETGIKEGCFDINKKFFPGKTEEEIKKIHLNNRINAMNKYGLDGRLVIKPRQKELNPGIDFEDGKYLILDINDIPEDLWYKNYYCDILILEENNKGIAIGHPMADCPIIIVEDRNKGVTAVSHCGAAFINRYLPRETIKALVKEYNSNLEDLYVYIGSCIKKESYIYDKYPSWATNEDVWLKYIKKEDDGYHIDMEGAIINQLEEFGINNINVSPIDTFKDDNYYSHVAVWKGNQKKLGENFVGCFYKKQKGD